MARHNRQGRGTDQNGSAYIISYQPDWLKQVKVTRSMDSGRQSTKTLFRNPEQAGRAAGSRVRTRIVSRNENLDFEIGLDDPAGVVTRIVVETTRPGKGGEASVIQFTLTDGQAKHKVRRKVRPPES